MGSPITRLIVQSILKIPLAVSVSKIISMAGLRLMFLVLGCIVLINADQGCDVNGKQYKRGERFMIRAPTGCSRCTCDGPGFMCVPACGLSMVNCAPPPFEELRYRMRKVAEGCFCKEPYCHTLLDPDVAPPGPPAPGQ